MTQTEANARAASAIVGELAAGGVSDAVISPGSRSTPLVLAIAACEPIRARVVTDERSASFFALGLARETGRPVILVCTSGTAVANYLPAVVEASLSNVSLVLLTADRPPELRDRGAPQTIRQTGLFATHARSSIDLLPPADDPDLINWLRSEIARALADAQHGPVHLNCPFREPLLDPCHEATRSPEPPPEEPWLRIHGTRPAPSVESLAALAAALARHSEGLLVTGPETGGPAAAPAVARLAHVLGWPILADPLSGLRFGKHDRSLVVDGYDLLLRDPRFVSAHHPGAVLQIGRLSASKPLERFLAAGASAEGASPRPIHVTLAPGIPFPDFLHLSTDLVRGDTTLLCEGLVAALETAPARDTRDPARPGHSSSWLAASRAVRAALERRLAAGDGAGVEGALFPELVGALPEGAVLHVGNSMPVRDADTFLAGSERRLEIVGNRGASGIDGVLSTALGAAAAGRRPTALVIGDLSLLHDVGALQIAAREPVSLLVVAVMNNGGGIFSFLPQAGLGDTFERFFGTPHGIDPGGAVRAAGAGWIALDQLDERFTVAVRAALAERGVTVIGIPFDRTTNAERHRVLLAAALEEGLGNIQPEAAKK